MKEPANATQVLKAEAKKLTEIIFHHRYCVVHYKKTGKQVFFKVEKHHLIRNSKRYKFNIWNILPVCENDHRWDELSAHEAEEKFRQWVKENLPKHWAWFQEHRYDKTVHLDSGHWSEICDDLRHYANHLYEAEILIYEKD